ncbi:IPT/TIG domain-containing protein [Actinoplanes sp. CA-142083]|uniref:IPT/TIG domain-containing protein n=1 Tax=Actinoplanes sp. CA-142083 TaxID=3239903 RepID=UPI003D9461EF
MTISQHTIRRAGLASAAATVLALAGTAVPVSAAAPALSLSAAAGPTGGGNTIIGTVAGTTANPSPFPAGALPTVQFQYAACTAHASSPTQLDVTGTTMNAGVLTVDPFDVNRISGTRIAFKVPSAGYPDLAVNSTGLVLGGDQTSATWTVCVYDSDSAVSSTLLATGSYTILPRPAITSITPASSPAVGGQAITVVGTGFTQDATVAIGGVAVTNLKIASTGTSLTATTAPKTAGAGLALTVTTPGGSVSSLDPDNNGNGSDAIPFSYSNGITVSPDTGPVGAAVTVDVTGAGFSQLQFDAGSGTPTSTNAHVFLVGGAYNSSNNRGVAECVRVAVISDTELICTLNLAGNKLSPADSSVVLSTPIDQGAYILTVVTNGAIGASANPTIISSGAAFVVAPY